MAKRFTDTEKWERPWFRELPSKYRELWSFVLDKCDVAGVWYIDFKLAEFCTGHNFDRLEAETLFSKQIEVNGDRWLVKDFVLFQYGHLTPENKIYKNVSAKLEVFNNGAYMGHKRGINAPKDKDKDKDKEKDKENEEGGMGGETKPRPETDIQKVVRAWKMLNSIPTDGDESKAWDKAHFPRCSKSAKTLIELFGNWEKAVEAMEYVYMAMTSKKLSCTIETTVKHSDLYREYLSGRVR